MMETVLYDDYNSMHNNFLTAGMNNQLKRKLTLDLDFGSEGSGMNAKQMSVIKKAKVASLNTPSSVAVLSSPDLYKLNLASPELERFIIQQASTLPTPNPAQNQIFFPKNVTEEQEAYVQGFTEALSKLHENPPTVVSSGNSLGMSNNIIINTSTSIQTLANATQLTQEQQQQLQILQLNNAQRLAQQQQQQQAEVQVQVQPPPPPYSYDPDSSSEDDSISENSCSNSTSSSMTYSNSGHMVLPTTIPSMLNSAHAAFPVGVSGNNNNNSIIHHRLPDYQLGPMATGSSGNIAAIPISAAGYSSQSPGSIHIKEEPQTVPNVSSPAPVSPIDMESQEKIKLERKRQRNRLAASKCRKRKLERISKLEDKVKQLKGENSDLSTVLAKLKDTVCTLKQQVMDHVNSGCQIIISPNLSSTF